MKRRTIKILIIFGIVMVLGLTGILLYVNLKDAGKPKAGRIEFGATYHLTEMRPHCFEGIVLNASTDSYFQIDTNQKTGTLHLDGVTPETIRFIVTKYQEGAGQTTIDIEFIYKNTLCQLTATSDDKEIRIRTTQNHRVDVTQENPDETRNLAYNVTILVFAKEAA